jgi:hypothetical protein
MTDTAPDTRPERRKLNDATIAAMGEAIAGGLTLERACHHLGINTGTWRRWRSAGDADLAEGRTDTLEARLCAAVHEARLHAERRAVLSIVQAATGEQQVTERTTTSTRWLREQDDAGEWHYVARTETTVTVEKRTVRDWRAGLAWLERTVPEVYARVTRQWVSGPEGEPVEVATVENLRGRLEVELEALALRLAENDPVAPLALGGADVLEPEA